MRILKYGSIVAVALLAAAIGFMSCSRGGMLASISVTPANPTIATGTKQQFTAVATFSDGTTIDWTTAAAWSTSDAAVTIGNSLGSYGLATLVTGTTGTFTITATDTVNNISGTATLYITVPQSIAITPANPFMAIETTHQFKATAVLPDLSTGGTTTITQDLTTYATWTTTSAVIATVSDSVGAKGRVTSVSSGTTDIKADIMTSQSTTASGFTTLTVTDTPLISVSLTQTDPTHFTATGHYAVTAVPQTQDFTLSVNWHSSKTGFATIDNTGLVTFVAPGQTIITATDPITGISSPGITLTVP